MKMVKEIETIPAQPERKIYRYKWIASDGAEFRSKDECEHHEHQLEVKKHPIFANCIHSVPFDAEEHYGVLYNLSSEEDYKYFCDHIGVRNWSWNDWEKYGCGWYLHYCDSCGDYDDDYLYNYSNFSAEQIAELKETYERIQEVRQMINDVSTTKLKSSIFDGEEEAAHHTENEEG